MTEIQRSGDRTPTRTRQVDTFTIRTAELCNQAGIWIKGEIEITLRPDSDGVIITRTVDTIQIAESDR